MGSPCEGQSNWGPLAQVVDRDQGAVHPVHGPVLVLQVVEGDRLAGAEDEVAGEGHPPPVDLRQEGDGAQGVPGPGSTWKA